MVNPPGTSKNQKLLVEDKELFDNSVFGKKLAELEKSDPLFSKEAITILLKLSRTDSEQTSLTALGVLLKTKNDNVKAILDKLESGEYVAGVKRTRGLSYSLMTKGKDLTKVLWDAYKESKELHSVNPVSENN